MPSFSFVARFAAVLSLMLFPLSAEVSAADDAAHRLADKFSAAADAEHRKAEDAERRKAEDAERRKAEEAEMLERARQEAADHAEAERAAETAADARMRELEAMRQAEAERLAEKLRRAEEAWRAKAASETGRAFKPALSKPPLSRPAEAEPERSPPVVAAPSVEREPFDRAPGDSIAREPLPEIRPDLREPPPHVAGAPTPLAPPMSLGRPGLDAEMAEPADRRVTVLLVMEPGRKGIRRFNKTADPVLCHNALCFVSNGATAPARIMTRHKALGAGNTLGKRAGACRHRLTCAFRGVELTGAAPVIQPVDLKILAHDRREARSVSGDTSCHVTVGRLSCGRTVVAAGYRAWVVPESVAERAGPAALEAALARGLVPIDLREAAARD